MSPSGPLNINKVATQEGSRVEVSVKSAEDEGERAVRLRKEWWTFIIKDCSPYLVAIPTATCALVYSMTTLFRTSSPAQEKQWAFQIFWALLAGVTGFVFGKSSK